MNGDRPPAAIPSNRVTQSKSVAILSNVAGGGACTGSPEPARGGGVTFALTSFATTDVRGYRRGTQCWVLVGGVGT
ncbi:hypothetical protein FrEUN1fDRAFT_2896 [Parafrankia sp. EUN1f]|nr:hypothetical protein FrEUN1fDRAFT_2896 [Parafrankia sp. EUN1f]